MLPMPAALHHRRGHLTPSTFQPLARRLSGKRPTDTLPPHLSPPAIIGAASLSGNRVRLSRDLSSPFRSAATTYSSTWRSR